MAERGNPNEVATARVWSALGKLERVQSAWLLFREAHGDLTVLSDTAEARDLQQALEAL